MENLGLWVLLSLQAINILVIVYLLIPKNPFSLLFGLILAGTTAGIEYHIATKK